MQVKQVLCSWKLWLGVIVLAFLVLIPFLGIQGGYLQTLGFLTFLYITLSTAWNILGGYAGQTSFGHATFYGLGAYTTCILALRGVPILLTIPIAGVVASFYGFLWGYPCLRLRGQYFAIATIGVGEATRLLMLNLDDLIKNNSLLKGFLQKGVLTGGATGLMLPTPEDIRAYATGFYYGVMVLMFAALGVSGYQVGNFPVGWAEWNGKYRDTIRRYAKGDGGQVAELGYRLTGSSHLYSTSGRRPFATVNFITAHHGFTLQDLVSYNDKHNKANGEDNRDGTDDNASWNCGVEGPTDDPAIAELRERQKRNFMAILFPSQGVPMICGGDELSRTQEGNNNAYCQDNELSWFNWTLDRNQRAFLAFVKQLIAVRKRHPVLRRRRFFQGRRLRGSEVKDVSWFRPDGKEMTDEDWNAGYAKSLALRLAGHAIAETDKPYTSVLKTMSGDGKRNSGQSRSLNTPSQSSSRIR